MANYSITLNFLLPKKIVEALKEVKVSGNFAFDWRKSDFCHCTVKAISISEEIPKKEILDDWITKSQKILDRQKSFKVKIKDVTKFPTALFAGVESKELSKLHKKLFKILPSSQSQFENDNYVPHASIGVLKNDGEFLSGKEQNFGEFKVKEIQLVIWNLKELNKSLICHKFRLAETL
ncbi:MAG: 2'-5' RNA ligase family protein [Candidatus Pacebacteria bacterium]|nr:2'-5' RNA ligase family protein [Candidatus Paceibacterota bacterium]